MTIAESLIKHIAEALPPGFETDIRDTARLSGGVIVNSGPDYVDVKFINRMKAELFMRDLQHADAPIPYEVLPGPIVRAKVP